MKQVDELLGPADDHFIVGLLTQMGCEAGVVGLVLGSEFARGRLSAD